MREKKKERERAYNVYRREVSENATFDRNGDNFKTCFFNNSFERVDNGASVNVVSLVRYPPHPDSGCKSRERLARWFSPVSNHWKAVSDGKIDFYSPHVRHTPLSLARYFFLALFFSGSLCPFTFYAFMTLNLFAL